MKASLRIIAILLVLGVAGLGGFVLCARYGLLTPSDAELQARYATPNSKFVDIDGEPIHYLDEGSGPAIVLLHGSYGSLLMWNDWAKALTGRYRVIRFDRPPMGLSGPDPKGHYDPMREMQLIGALATKLGIDRFVLVATSSAGIAGAGFAAEHPERLTGVILTDIAVGPLNMDRSHLSSTMKLILMVDPVFNGWHLQEFWRQILLANFADPNKVTPELVRQWADLNSRAQAMPPAPDSISIRSTLGRTPADLPKITAPALLLWGEDDPEIPVSTGEKALSLLGSSDKALMVVPHCGHMLPLECGPESVALALPFLDRITASDR